LIEVELTRGDRRRPARGHRGPDRPAQRLPPADPEYHRR
jgi:hypothetical protein